MPDDSLHAAGVLDDLAVAVIPARRAQCLHGGRRSFGGQVPVISCGRIIVIRFWPMDLGIYTRVHYPDIRSIRTSTNSGHGIGV